MTRPLKKRKKIIEDKIYGIDYTKLDQMKALITKHPLQVNASNSKYDLYPCSKIL
jgi:hypothetical protein